MTSPNIAKGKRNGKIVRNAIVTAADAIPSERRKVGPQQATPVSNAGIAENKLLDGLRLQTVRARYV